jgi:hypothetical protein
MAKQQVHDCIWQYQSEASDVLLSKPYYNDQNKSYFHQLADGELQMMTPPAIAFGPLLWAALFLIE